MKEFIYYQDEKVTIWRRSTFSVKAKTKKCADELVRGLNGASIFDIRESKDVNPVGSDFLLETKVTLLPKDNGGNSTIEHFRRMEQFCLATGVNATNTKLLLGIFHATAKSQTGIYSENNILIF